MSRHENLFLASLARDDRAALAALTETVEYALGDVILFEGKIVEYVWFPTNSVVSFLATLADGKTFEASTTGRDGAIAVTPALDGRVSLTRVVVKSSGGALRCRATDFKKLVLGRPSLLSAMMRHEHTLLAQTQQMAACRAGHDTRQQLAHLLLRFADLTGSSEIHLTQSFLAEMLGTRRSTVTVNALDLEAKNIIGYQRGKIRITDRPALKDASCECYDLIAGHYRALLEVGKEAQ